MFRPAPALDIFGDDEHRRCTPDEAAKDLFDLHLRVAVIYGAAYTAIEAMPYCTELTAVMEERGHPLSLLEGDQSSDTPWGMGNSSRFQVTFFCATNTSYNTLIPASV